MRIKDLIDAIGDTNPNTPVCVRVSKDNSVPIEWVMYQNGCLIIGANYDNKN